MPVVTYESRLVLDFHFYEEIIRKNPKLLMKLMYINANSRGHKRTSNIMSKNIFNKILEMYPSMHRSTLRSACFDIEVGELEEIEDEIERVIKYAIHITEETPHKSIILTSEEKVNEYEKNPHYKNVKEISIKGGEDAIILIETYWKECTER